MTSQPDNLNAVIFGVEGPRLTFWEKAFFADTQPFGFILFARNVETADQLRALCSDLRTAVGWNAPILIDQEGGRVQRLVPPMATQFLPPLDHAASAGAEAVDAFFARYAIIGHELRGYGIDVIVHRIWISRAIIPIHFCKIAVMGARALMSLPLGRRPMMVCWPQALCP